MSEENADLRYVSTPEFRFAYPNLFKPSKPPGSNNEPKYSLTALIPKRDEEGNPTDMTIYKEAMYAAKVKKWGADESKWPEVIHQPIKNGDKLQDKKTGKLREDTKGYWVIDLTAKQDQRPGVVGMKTDDDGKWLPITEPSEVYGGCYGRAAIRAGAWHNPIKGFGVSFYLDHVQKTRDGKPFGNKKTVDQVFAPMGGAKKKQEIADDEEF